METVPETKIDLQYKEYNVYCLLSRCTIDKKYSLLTLSNKNLKSFIDRLYHLEKMTWSQLSGAPREKGLTKEIDISKSYEMIRKQDSHTQPGEDRYYFHIRVKTKEKFRLFGYQYKQFFCITHIDPEGEIHRRVHK